MSQHHYTEDVPSTNKGNERSFVANPRAPKGDDINESTGPIASDSLAAESANAGGAFADNDQSTPLSVRGDQSTLANTDTSGARTLPPARSAADREREEYRGQGADERGSAGGAYPAAKYPDGASETRDLGQTSDQGYSGDTSKISSSGSSNINTSSSGTSNTNTSSSGSGGATAGVRPYVDDAPTYAQDTRSAGQLQPKGDNLTEGGDVPANVKTFIGDVGGPNDPGRLAEQKFQKYNAESGNDAAQARSYGGSTDESKGGFENLNESERL